MEGVRGVALELTEGTRSGAKQDWLDELVSRLRPIFEEHGVLRAILFGSLARGEASRRSDLDLILVQDTDKRFLDRYDDLLGEIAQVVSGRDVDLLIHPPKNCIGWPIVR